MPEKNNGINPIGIALAGAAIGAVAVALSDKKNRTKLAKTADNVKKDVVNKLSEVKDMATDKIGEVTNATEDKIETLKSDVKEKKDLAKKALDKGK